MRNKKNAGLGFVAGKHYDTKLEKAVLGCLMMDNSVLHSIAPILSEQCFYSVVNKEIYKVVVGLIKDNHRADIFAVVDAMMRIKGIAELDGEVIPAYVVSCQNEVIDPTAGIRYSFILAQMLRSRIVLEVTSTPIDAADDPDRAIRDIESKLSLLKVSEAARNVTTEDALIRLYAFQDKVRDRDMMGITTGITELDGLTGGYCDAGLYVVAARPSMGKSAFMGKNVLHAARAGAKVGIIQLEMSIEQTIARVASLHSDIPYASIITGFRNDDQERERFYGVMGGMSSLPININPSSLLTVDAIKAYAYGLKNKDRLDILFVDYLQLIEGDGNSRVREQEVSKMSRGLKLLAKDLNIPVVALSQLNRAVESRGNRLPMLSDLRESGAIEQDADAVYFIHRDFQAGILYDEAGNSTENQAKIVVAKNRNGSRGVIELFYDGQKMKFYEQGQVLDGRREDRAGFGQAERGSVPDRVRPLF